MTFVYVYNIEFENGKGYIGITKDIDKRMLSHRYSKYPVGKAMRKYKHKVNKLMVCHSYADAFSVETELIREFKPILYNITDGGEGSSGHIHSDTTRKKMSEKRRLRKITETTKIRTSKSIRKWWETNTRILSQESRDRMSASQRERYTKGDYPNTKLCWSDIPIINDMLSNGLLCTDIANLYNVSRSTISKIKLNKYWT